MAVRAVSRERTDLSLVKLADLHFGCSQYERVLQYAFISGHRSAEAVLSRCDQRVSRIVRRRSGWSVSA
jgi:hypothetical protein